MVLRLCHARTVRVFSLAFDVSKPVAINPKTRDDSQASQILVQRVEPACAGTCACVLRASVCTTCDVLHINQPSIIHADSVMNETSQSLNFSRGVSLLSATVSVPGKSHCS